MEVVANPNRELWEKLSKRPVVPGGALSDLVKKVFDEVREEGDVAVRKFTQRFDRQRLKDLKIKSEEIESAKECIPEKLKKAINLAIQNIQSFHQSQVMSINKVTTMPGVECWQESRPIDPIGIYIPGGSAPLFSTVLMLGIPAKIAGCRNVIMCSPPSADGTICPEILFAAQAAGISQIFKVGGIQAIAALTYGTDKIPAVNKIFGPGNQYVTAAKLEALRRGIAIDLPAGPSELFIIADNTANATFVAADILSQAEHGADSQVICVVNNRKLADNIRKQLSLQLKELPRQKIVKQTLRNSRIVILKNLNDAVNFANVYSPEHLIMAIKNTSKWTKKISNAGSVFLGNFTPESAGDYASGTNHTLPTNGYARAYSGITMDDFVKKISFQKITRKGISKIGWAVEEMAEAEGLAGHKNAITIRLNNL